MLSSQPRDASVRRERSHAATMAAVVGVALVVVLLLVFAVFWLTFLRPSTSIEAGKPVQIEIASGSTTADIGRQLAAVGVIRNPNMLRLQSRIEGADGQLHAGVYDMRTGMDYDDVLALLRSGPPIAYATVTIPEGFVLEQIAERLEAKAGVPADSFLAMAKTGAPKFAAEHPYLEDAYNGSLEGFLFPKTYRIRQGAPVDEVIEMMLNQFDEEIAQVDLARAEQAGISTRELVIMASIIERETKVAKERPLVSSVIYNRLRIGMKLEIDATIEYVLPGNRFRLRNSDLRLDSPYNTYRNKGLTPGPISNPGLASLQAAANPAETSYIYYVLTGKDGTHTFASDLNTFLAAKRKSKEVFGR